MPKDAPLHFLWTLHEWYLREYNDPIVGWTPESAGMGWVPFFMHIETFFSLPVVLYALYRIGGSRAGTTGPLELLLLIYSFHTSFTTAICINDVLYWDPAVYSPAQKKDFFQMFTPWCVIRKSNPLKCAVVASAQTDFAL